MKPTTINYTIEPEAARVVSVNLLLAQAQLEFIKTLAAIFFENNEVVSYLEQEARRLKNIIAGLEVQAGREGVAA